MQKEPIDKLYTVKLTQWIISRVKRITLIRQEKVKNE